ncbi:TolC family outer membrane protein [Devosia sp. ZB163]|uniref:TolC family outer membrane protein n=1 Tax=Devosia sp. ZB163 TaxID=3025938 RepID=UPI00235DF284|nr:TolC family outer membrane protein [Devosia sp. ZB163]MDC9824282.1 TolC family outer membrane protein [Devosia sp. ZB163]
MGYLGAMRAGALAIALSLVPAAAQAETLSSALTSAYLNNPEIMSALLNVKATAENIALAKSAKLPSIGVSGTFGGSWTAPQGGDVFTALGSTAGINYSQTLFDNFKTEADIEQARAGTELSKYALRNVEQNILFSVVQAYYAVIRDTQLVQLRQDNMAFYDAQLTSAEDRLRLGEGTKIDVSQAQTRQIAGVALYQSAIASLQTSQASYERYVGHKPRNLVYDFNFGKSLPTSIDAGIASAEDRHPALLAARAAIRVAQAGSDAASAAFGPTLSLIGSIETSIAYASERNLQPAGTASDLTGSAQLRLSVPLYSGGALSASLRKANIQQIQSEVDALGAFDTVKEAVISSWSTLQNAISQIQSAEAAVASAELVVEGTIQERDVGQKTTLDVLNAQAEYSTAREALISARTTRMVAAFALLAASGRLSPDVLGLNIPVHSADGYIATVEDVWLELRALDE